MPGIVDAFYNWLHAHDASREIELGLIPSGRGFYKCSCGATSANIAPIAHVPDCLWLKTDGDLNMFEFLRGRTSIVLGAGAGTLKAKSLGQQMARFDRECGGGEMKATLESVRELVLDFLELEDLPHDVLEILSRAYIEEWVKLRHGA